jgi:hypothetical protein
MGTASGLPYGAAKIRFFIFIFIMLIGIGNVLVLVGNYVWLKFFI